MSDWQAAIFWQGYGGITIDYSFDSLNIISPAI